MYIKSLDSQRTPRRHISGNMRHKPVAQNTNIPFKQEVQTNEVTLDLNFQLLELTTSRINSSMNKWISKE